MLVPSGAAMNVERQAKPLYQVVVESVLSQVESGQLQANERLPSESELSKIYSVGRNTIRRAIQGASERKNIKNCPWRGNFCR